MESKYPDETLHVQDDVNPKILRMLEGSFFAWCDPHNNAYAKIIVEVIVKTKVMWDTHTARYALEKKQKLFVYN